MSAEVISISPVPKRCHSCVYWCQGFRKIVRDHYGWIQDHKPHDWLISEGYQYGECRIDSPQIPPGADVKARPWPQTHADDYCAYWEGNKVNGTKV